jgi:hypothetical protein
MAGMTCHQNLSLSGLKNAVSDAWNGGNDDVLEEDLH